MAPIATIETQTSPQTSTTQTQTQTTQTQTQPTLSIKQQELWNEFEKLSKIAEEARNQKREVKSISDLFEKALDFAKKSELKSEKINRIEVNNKDK